MRVKAFLGGFGRAVEANLLDRPAGQNREIPDQAIGQLACNRQLAVPLEFLDRSLRVGPDNAGRLELAIAIFGQRALDGGDAPSRHDEIADRIALRCVNRRWRPQD